VIFNTHKLLEGQHAFLSPSKYNWINYDDEKIVESFLNYKAAQRGTDLHNLAAQAISLGVSLPKTNKQNEPNKTLNLYVNDAIGFRMKPEVCLYYSANAFGTADALCFRNNFLRIHDLKTGKTPASMKQLEIYEALFCLEYDQDPRKIESELRLYQLGEILVNNPDPEEILYIMNKIVVFDRKITEVTQIQ